MKNLLLILSLILGISGYSQSGFYGKKTVIDVSGGGRIPLFNNYLATRTSVFNPQAGIGISRALSNKVSIGLEFIEGFNTLPPEKYLGSYYKDSSYYEFIEPVRFRSHTFLFKVEIGERNFAPYGFSHQIGIGPTFCNYVDKEYRTTETNDYGYYYDPYNSFNKPLSSYKSTSLTLAYTIQVRTAITKALWFHAGVRTTLNMPLDNFDPFDILSASVGKPGSALSSSMLRNIFSLKMGLSFAI